MIKRLQVCASLILLLAETIPCCPQAVAIYSGQNLVPGGYTALRYEHFSNTPVNLCGGVFYESSRHNGLRYRAYGIDLIAQYANARDNEGQFGFRLGLGATCLLESEPWIYQNIPASQRMTYGLLGEVDGEWWMTDQFSLVVFGQQKYLVNGDLGHTRSAIGLGLKFHFDN